jgi:hypothetical protein
MNYAHPRSFGPLCCTFSLLALSACGSSNGNSETATDSGAPTDTGAAAQDAAGLDGHTGDAAVAPDSGSDAGPAVLAVALSSCIPTIYTMPVTLGGTQSFEMVLDTGSTTLGVAATGCSCGPATPLYTPGSTAVDQKQTATTTYASGSWAGEVFQDTVSIGTSPATPTKLVAISSETNFFEPLQCDSKSPGMQGIVGFGPSGAADMGTTGFFDAYVAQYKVPDVFATELCDTTGTLWLGGYDPAAMTAAPQYTPIASFVSSLYYAINLASITANGTTVPITGQLPDSLVDTGTSEFLLNTTAYGAIVAAIQSDAMFTQVFGASFFPPAGTQSPACASVTQTKAALDAALPALTLTFGTSPAITVKAVATESYLFHYGSQWCSAIAAPPSGTQFPVGAIMGAPVLRSNVVIFDRAQSRIGFAPHAPCP